MDIQSSLWCGTQKDRLKNSQTDGIRLRWNTGFHLKKSLPGRTVFLSSEVCIHTVALLSARFGVGAFTRSSGYEEITRVG